MLSKLGHIISLILVGAVLSGCAFVDEDLRDCETDYTMDYQLRLVTNMTTELKTQLSMEADVTVATALEAYLKDVFTDKAHDIDLSFYDVTGDSLRLHHEKHIMDASQSSYTLFIPVHKYMHVCVANLDQNGSLSLISDDRCHAASLHQQVADTVPPHSKGLFTARLPMDVQEGVDQHFDVRLYMANCASALVLDTLGCNLKDIQVYASGFATDFDVADSLYRFQYTPIVRTQKLNLDEKSPAQICFATVTFPSRTKTETKVVIESEDDDVNVEAGDAPWQFRIYSTLQDNSVTETQLSIFKPILASHLRVLKAKVYRDGSLIPGDPTVGVSVTLDWTPGLDHQVVL